MYMVNGVLTADKPTVTLGDFGFARGITVFELFRVYGRTPFRMGPHLDRLERGCAVMGIELPFSRAELEQQIATLMAQHTYPHSAVKLYVTAGECGAPSGLSLAACTNFAPQLYILEDAVTMKHPQAAYGMENHVRGQNLKSVDAIRELPEVKTANYGIGYVAAKRAGTAYDDVLFTTPQGFVTEATRSNFFAVINDKLVTAKSGMLEGITRGVILELAAELGIATEVRDVTVAELAGATEAFTSGSIAEMVPVRSLNDVVLPGGDDRTQTPVFRALREAFTARVAQECGDDHSKAA